MERGNLRGGLENCPKGTFKWQGQFKKGKLCLFVGREGGEGGSGKD